MGRALLCAWLAALYVGSGSVALAQEKEATPPGEAPAEPPAASPPGGEAEPPATSPPGTQAPPTSEAPTPSEQVGTGHGAWSDISVVERRPVLKRRRVEFMPTYNVTL